jgi:hypothetical protein
VYSGLKGQFHCTHRHASNRLVTARSATDKSALGLSVGSAGSLIQATLPSSLPPRRGPQDAAPFVSTDNRTNEHHSALSHDSSSSSSSTFSSYTAQQWNPAYRRHAWFSSITLLKPKYRLTEFMKLSRLWQRFLDVTQCSTLPNYTTSLHHDAYDTTFITTPHNKNPNPQSSRCTAVRMDQHFALQLK